MLFNTLRTSVINSQMSLLSLKGVTLRKNVTSLSKHYQTPLRFYYCCYPCFPYFTIFSKVSEEMKIYFMNREKALGKKYDS